ncbi:MAG: hypothetical protein ACLFUI_11195 [Halanaerobiales bacterium]
MRRLATYVREEKPAPGECKLINNTFQKLKAEVEKLDKFSQLKSNKFRSNNSKNNVKV